QRRDAGEEEGEILKSLGRAKAVDEQRQQDEAEHDAGGSDQLEDQQVASVRPERRQDEEEERSWRGLRVGVAGRKLPVGKTVAVRAEDRDVAGAGAPAEEEGQREEKRADAERGGPVAPQRRHAALSSAPVVPSRRTFRTASSATIPRCSSASARNEPRNSPRVHAQAARNSTSAVRSASATNGAIQSRNCGESTLPSTAATATVAAAAVTSCCGPRRGRRKTTTMSRVIASRGRDW